MADNPSIPVAAGTLLAADDIGGVIYQRVKVTFGADGAAADVSSAAPLPVAGAFFQATQPVSATALPLPLGAATEATIAAMNGKLPTLGGKAASGSLSVTPTSDGFGVTVTNTVAISAAALPLPVGAATSAGQTSAATIMAAVQAATEAAQPATQAFAITPHDTNPITPLPRAVRVNVAGTVTFRLSGSAADVTINALAGEVIPGRVQYIRATGTAATGLLGLA